MNRIYSFLRNHKAIMWAVLIVSVLVFGALGWQCRMIEDVFAILPRSNQQTEMNLAFSNLKIKDKIFVQVVSRSPEVSREILAEAMDAFSERLEASDSDHVFIRDYLTSVDPTLLLDVADWMASHAPLYTDLSPAELDSLTSEQHIRQSIPQMLSLLDSEQGYMLYDLVGYDPCGISLSRLSVSAQTPQANEHPRFEQGHLFSYIGDSMTICVGWMTPALAVNQTIEASHLLRLMESTAKEVEEAYPDVEIVYHSLVLQAGGNSIRIKRDLLLSVGISIAVITLLLGICFRRPKYLLAIILPVVYGALMALAIIYLVQGEMSLLSLGIGAIVLGVALSYSLHVVVHYAYTGDAEETIRIQTNPVLMGTLTTVGAFAGLMFTSSSLLKDFGLFAGLTVFGTTIAALLFMPHFFPRNFTTNAHAFRFLERVNAYRIDSKRTICWLVVLIVGVLIGNSHRYTFDSDLSHFGYISETQKHSVDLWNRSHHDGLRQQYFAIRATNEAEALELLPRLEEKCEQLQGRGLISRFTRMSALLPSLSLQQQRANAWSEYFTPERQQIIRTRIARVCTEEGVDAEIFAPFYELMYAAPSAELLTESGLLEESYLCNLRESIDSNTMVFLPVCATDSAMIEVKQELANVPGCVVLDPYFYTTSLVELIHGDFDRIMLISSIFVFLLLLLNYRNPVIAFIAFLPMGLSWYAVLGAMALTGQSFNLINIVVSSFIFGIGVDYSIFITDGLIRTQECDHKTLVYHKTAITLSATILCLCMFSLFFAKHPAVHSIAFSSLVGMITTLMLCYTVQPNLYRLYIRYKNHKK